MHYLWSNPIFRTQSLSCLRAVESNRYKHVSVCREHGSHTVENMTSKQKHTTNPVQNAPQTYEQQSTIVAIRVHCPANLLSSPAPLNLKNVPLSGTEHFTCLVDLNQMCGTKKKKLKKNKLKHM